MRKVRGKQAVEELLMDILLLNLSKVRKKPFFSSKSNSVVWAV